MQAKPAREAGKGRRVNGARLAALSLTVALGGCASGIQTPLPDMTGAGASSSMSLQDRQKAVDELERAGATHEQAAEREIENSR